MLFRSEPSAALTQGYNPYARLRDSIGSGPHSPIANQIYATAASRASAATLPATASSSLAGLMHWLLPVLVFAGVLTVAGFIAHQLGFVRFGSPKADKPALVRPD